MVHSWVWRSFSGSQVSPFANGIKYNNLKSTKSVRTRQWFLTHIGCFIFTSVNDVHWTMTFSPTSTFLRYFLNLTRFCCESQLEISRKENLSDCRSTFISNLVYLYPGRHLLSSFRQLQRMYKPALIQRKGKHEIT